MLSRDHSFFANIISNISKKVNINFRKASRGVRPGLHFNYE